MRWDFRGFRNLREERTTTANEAFVWYITQLKRDRMCTTCRCTGDETVHHTSDTCKITESARMQNHQTTRFTGVKRTDGEHRLPVLTHNQLCPFGVYQVPGLGTTKSASGPDQPEKLPELPGLR
jgi:hypothetical protein